MMSDGRRLAVGGAESGEGRGAAGLGAVRELVGDLDEVTCGVVGVAPAHEVDGPIDL